MEDMAGMLVVRSKVLPWAHALNTWNPQTIAHCYTQLSRLMYIFSEYKCTADTKYTIELL